MLIAVSGTQGAGKSTLLDEIAKLDYTVDDFKVSRTIQKEMGFSSFDEIYSSFETMKSFQENVLLRKFEHDLGSVKSEDVIFVERSFYDILAYTELHLTRIENLTPLAKDWLASYAQACFKYQKIIYDGLILVEPHSKIKYENDVHRGDQESQTWIDLRLKELCAYSTVPIEYMTEFDLENRVKIATKFVEKLK